MKIRTVVESPQARFRREAGLPDIPVSRPSASSWMKLNCGDLVREKDGRHIGRVEAIDNSALVRVRWENGWISDMELSEIERVKP